MIFAVEVDLFFLEVNLWAVPRLAVWYLSFGVSPARRADVEYVRDKVLSLWTEACGGPWGQAPGRRKRPPWAVVP